VRLASLAVLGAALLVVPACRHERPVGPAESGTVTRVELQEDRNRDVVEVETPDGQPFTVRLDVGDCKVGDAYPDCTTD
jgi:hypothetical protein